MERFRITWNSPPEGRMSDPPAPREINADNWLVAVGLVLDDLGMDRDAFARVSCDLLPDGSVSITDPQSGVSLFVTPFMDDEDDDDQTLVVPRIAMSAADPTEAPVAPAVPKNNGPVLDAPEPTTSEQSDGVALEQIDIAMADFEGKGSEAASEHALDVLLARVPAESASVLLHDPDNNALRFHAVRGPRADALRGMAIPADAGIAGLVLDQGLTMLVREPAKDPLHYQAVDDHTGYQTTSLLAVPLASGGQTIGVLELLNPFGGSTFLEWHQLATIQVAQKLAAVLQSA